MPRLWIVPAAGLGCAGLGCLGLACAALAGPAVQRLATLPIATSPVTAQPARQPAHAARAGAAELDRIPLRGLDPETTGALPVPAPTPGGRPPCPPGRRIGTGAGFCVIN